MIPGLEHKRLRSFDGTEIAYQTRGKGPAIVLANGLGGFYEAYRPIYEALGERYRILCWDYRGIFRSQVPRDRSTLAVPYHCDDLELILDHEGIDRAVFIGWSMGVQVNFEFFRHRRDRMDALIAVGGTYGTPFRTMLSSRMVQYAIPAVLRAIGAQAPLVNHATRTLAGWNGIIPTIKRLGIVSEALDEEAFREVLEGFATVDWRVYSEALGWLGRHDARDVLPKIDMPTLIMAGDRDILVPAFIAEQTHRAIPGSRLVIVEGGTHYALMEYPRVFRDELLALLAQVPGYEPAAAEAVAGAGGERAGSQILG
jgi:pimeloyl-ACP methyl ester carboxylesterase